VQLLAIFILLFNALATTEIYTLSLHDALPIFGIDPVNPDNVFVGTGTPTPAMLFRSKDSGQSWEKRPVEVATECEAVGTPRFTGDRKSTRLNSSHDQISYAVFCLKKKKRTHS